MNEGIEKYAFDISGNANNGKEKRVLYLRGDNDFDYGEWIDFPDKPDFIEEYGEFIPYVDYINNDNYVWMDVGGEKVPYVRLPNFEEWKRKQKWEPDKIIFLSVKDRLDWYFRGIKRFLGRMKGRHEDGCRYVGQICSHEESYRRAKKGANSRRERSGNSGRS